MERRKILIWYHDSSPKMMGYMIEIMEIPANAFLLWHIQDWQKKHPERTIMELYRISTEFKPVYTGNVLTGISQKISP